MTSLVRFISGLGVVVVCAEVLVFAPTSAYLAVMSPALRDSSTQVSERASANDNRVAAGRIENDTLVLRLTVRPVDWHILGDSNPPFRVLAFAEQGKPASIPAPLIRTSAGTPTSVLVENPLDDTLIVHGLSGRGGLRDSVLIGPGDTAIVRATASRVGTYAYWATTATTRRINTGQQPPPASRKVLDSQLGGAFVVDSRRERPHDRVFVITELGDRLSRPNAPESRDRHGAILRQFNAVNGRAWPNSERLQYALGDSIRWRVVNVSPEAHPMHLHGFYFRVDRKSV